MGKEKLCCYYCYFKRLNSYSRIDISFSVFARCREYRPARQMFTFDIAKATPYTMKSGQLQSDTIILDVSPAASALVPFIVYDSTMDIVESVEF